MYKIGKIFSHFEHEIFVPEANLEVRQTTA